MSAPPATHASRTPHIAGQHIDSPDQIRITWDTSLASKYDNRTADELEAHNTRGRNDWAAKLVAARASAVEQA